MPCDSRCWADVKCTKCGRRKERHGRDNPPYLFGAVCSPLRCDGYYDEPKAPHLQDEHDSDRAYTDPDGWAAHFDNCALCKEY